MYMYVCIDMYVCMYFAGCNPEITKVKNHTKVTFKELPITNRAGTNRPAIYYPAAVDVKVI